MQNLTFLPCLPSKMDQNIKIWLARDGCVGRWEKSEKNSVFLIFNFIPPLPLSVTPCCQKFTVTRITGKNYIASKEPIFTPPPLSWSKSKLYETDAGEFSGLSLSHVCVGGKVDFSWKNLKGGENFITGGPGTQDPPKNFKKSKKKFLFSKGF